jgi:hypothetical protein
MQKLGLRIYAKQWSLVAYTEAADDYADENDPLMKANHGAIPNLSKHCLNDSGADDFANYISEKIELFNPDGFKLFPNGRLCISS